MNNLFLTGRPRVGKTSLLKQALSDTGASYGGFAVQRLQQAGRTAAFRMLDLGYEDYRSEQEIGQDLSDEIVIFLGPDGKWRGKPAVFDGKGRQAILAALNETVPLIVMDELGIFEREAQAFQAAVQAALDSSIPVLGVLKDKSSPFLDSVRAHAGTSILSVTGNNFQEAYTGTCAFLKKRMGEIG